MKKSLAILIILCMTLSVVAGCSSGAAKPAAPTTAPTAPTTAPTAAPAAPAAPKGIAWPEKPIQVYIPFDPGGDTDLHARKIGEIMTELLGKPVVCTNMAGSGGGVAARYVKDAAKDGYSVLFHQSSFLVSSLVNVIDFNYNDLATAGTICLDNTSMIMLSKVAAKKKGITDIKSFIQYGKDHPGDLLYATTIGGYSQLQGLAAADAMGIKVTSVDVGGTTQVIPTLISGDCDFALGIYATFYPYVTSGDFIALAVAGKNRLDVVPDIPSMKDLGYDFGLTKQFGFYFPKGTDPAIVAKWEEALKKAVADKRFVDYCAKTRVEPFYTGGKDCLDFHDQQYAIMKNYQTQLTKQK